jgi:hypothetical protein
MKPEIQNDFIDVEVIRIPDVDGWFWRITETNKEAHALVTLYLGDAPIRSLPHIGRSL